MDPTTLSAESHFQCIIESSNTRILIVEVIMWHIVFEAICSNYTKIIFERVLTREV